MIYKILGEKIAGKTIWGPRKFSPNIAGVSRFGSCNKKDAMLTTMKRSFVKYKEVSMQYLVNLIQRLRKVELTLNQLLNRISTIDSSQNIRSSYLNISGDGHFPYKT